MQAGCRTLTARSGGMVNETLSAACVCGRTTRIQIVIAAMNRKPFLLFWWEERSQHMEQHHSIKPVKVNYWSSSSSSSLTETWMPWTGWTWLNAAVWLADSDLHQRTTETNSEYSFVKNTEDKNCSCLFNIQITLLPSERWSLYLWKLMFQGNIFNSGSSLLALTSQINPKNMISWSI